MARSPGCPLSRHRAKSSGRCRASRGMNNGDLSSRGKSASAIGIGLTLPHSVRLGADQGIP